MPPQSLFALPTQNGLRMQFQGTITKVPCRVLADSGATHCYVSKAFLERHGIHYAPCEGVEVKLADAKLTTPIVGECRLNLCIQKFRSRGHFSVIDLFDTFDVVLGDDWMTEHRAVMDWHVRSLSVRRGKRCTFCPPSGATRQSPVARCSRPCSCAEPWVVGVQSLWGWSKR